MCERVSIYAHGELFVTFNENYTRPQYQCLATCADCQLPFALRDKISGLYRQLKTLEESGESLPGESWTTGDEEEYRRWVKRFDELFRIKERHLGSDGDNRVPGPIRRNKAEKIVHMK
ncbi:hypothetical protein BESB_044450 [Besnoitia besnoiti]|uniref:Uncharacterized protein n=1 Tax=Besnoitia besnoiti TaxID=94643 RepID=A0A2A9MKP1_BESBE|nr:hypothetical protein BESB_044450 [Besnoitia besnoiti]PFH36253.1 hypothetical protein BESB_044450 [Besnoitia besnoiti]